MLVRDYGCHLAAVLATPSWRLVVLVVGELQPRLAEDVLQRPAGARPQGRGLLHSLWRRGLGQDGHMTIITRYSVNVLIKSSYSCPLPSVPCIDWLQPVKRKSYMKLQCCKVRVRGRGHWPDRVVRHSAAATGHHSLLLLPRDYTK